MNRIFSSDLSNLVIDLRNNSGGNAEPALILAEYLTNESLTGGFFLSRKWYENQTDKLPTENEINSFASFNEGDIDDLLQEISENQGLRLLSKKTEAYFDGNVYVLVNKNTASTAEAIAYDLSYHGIATIIGETTAGKMLSAQKFKITNNFFIFLPTANYFAYDGYRIEGNGVEPDIKTASKEALDEVINLIRSNNNAEAY